MTDIPIILVHRDNHYYLRPVLEQAHAFNKNTTIHLIGNENNNVFDFVEHHLYSDYFSTAFEFEKIYRHMSPNSWAYETFCFQRWFIINEFVKKHNIETFLCMDSDFLFFCNVSETFAQYLDYDFTICGHYFPCATLFNQKNLDKFCNFITQMYTDPVYIDRLWDKYVKMKKEGGTEGNSDMTAFSYYQEYVSKNVKELSEINENNETFDYALTRPGDYCKDEKGQKKIFWEGSRPYGIIESTGQKVYFLGLHLQGYAKYDIFSLLVDKNTERGLLFRIKTALSLKAYDKRKRRRKHEKRLHKREKK